MRKQPLSYRSNFCSAPYFQLKKLNLDSRNTRRERHLFDKKHSISSGQRRFLLINEKFIAEGKELPEHYKHHMKDIDHYELDEDKNVLGRYYRPLQTYRQNDTRLIPVIPKSMEGEVIYFSHVVNGCHMGEAKTMGRIKGNFHFPNMYKKVKEFIQSCEDCAKHKSPQTMPRAELGTYGVPAGVGDLISIDIWGSGGGLPVSAQGNRCVLTIVDHFNSFYTPTLCPMKKQALLQKL